MKLRHSFRLLLLLTAIVILEVKSAKINKKVRRSALSLPSGGTLSITMDLIIPVVPLINSTLTYLWFDLPITFDLPTASALNDLYTSLGLLSRTSNDNNSRNSNEVIHDFVEEKRANHDRRQVYKYAESFFQNFGFNGTACLMRAICELAEAPLDNHGLFGKIFDILFVPNPSEFPEVLQQNLINFTSLPPELHFLGKWNKDEYTEAYVQGKISGGCPTHFSACPISVFKLLDF